MKVGIVGFGYVGSAVARAVRPYHVVSVADPRLHNLTWEGDRQAVNTCDLAFVCVPTPSGEDGRLDTSAVEEVLSWLTVPLVVIRSTMPAFCADYEWDGEHLRTMVYQPEFIGESPWAPWREETDCTLVVAGSNSFPDSARQVLDFWKPIIGPKARYLATTWQTAAEIKFANNLHGLVKCAWWHEFLGNCGDADAVRNAVLNLPWVEEYHTLPLGGVDGKCFPKDGKHWLTCHDSPMLKAALQHTRG